MRFARFAVNLLTSENELRRNSGEISRISRLWRCWWCQWSCEASKTSLNILKPIELCKKLSMLTFFKWAINVRIVIRIAQIFEHSESLKLKTSGLNFKLSIYVLHIRFIHSTCGVKFIKEFQASTHVCSLIAFIVLSLAYSLEHIRVFFHWNVAISSCPSSVSNFWLMHLAASRSSHLRLFIVFRLVKNSGPMYWIGLLFNLIAFKFGLYWSRSPSMDWR